MDGYNYSGNDPRQTMAFLQMGDLSSQERLLMQQQAQAARLREQGTQPSARMDAGSQMARALQGFAGAQGYKKYEQGMKDFSAEKQRTLANIERMLFEQKQQQRQGMPQGVSNGIDDRVPPGGPY